MRRLFVLLLAATTLAQQSTPNKQQSINSIQQSSGNCSVNVAGVQGNADVHVMCDGLSPKVLKLLDKTYKELLDRGQINESALRNEAQEWQTRYLELADRMANASIGSGLSQKAKDFLERGEFEKAAVILDQAIASDEKDVERAAEDNYKAAQLDWLQFRPMKALEHQGVAYQYRPQIIRYGIDYQVLLQKANRYVEAEAVGLANLKRVHALPVSDPERIGMLTLVQNDLGILYENTSRLKEAEEAFEDALRNLKSDVTRNLQTRQAIAGTLNNLAQMHVKSGRFEEAVSEYEESIDAFHKLSMENHGIYDLEMAGVITNHGALRMLLGDFRNAHYLLNYALTIEKDHGVGNGRGSPTTLGDLAILYEKKCDPDAAENIAVSLTEFFEGWARFSPEFAEPTLALSYRNLGALYLDIGEPFKADDAFSKAKDIYVRLAADDKRQYLVRKIWSIEYLALAKRLEGKLSDAERLSQEAVAGWNEAKKISALNLDPQEIAFAISEAQGNLAEIYAKIGRYADAETTYKEALAIYYEDPNAMKANLRGLGDLAKGAGSLYRSLNRPSDAAPMYAVAEAVYHGLVSTDCHVHFRRDLADSSSGAAWSYAQLQQTSIAINEAISAVSTYRDLRRLDPTFTTEDFAHALLAEASILKKAGADSADWCPIVAEILRMPVENATKEAATALLGGWPTFR